MNPFLNGFWAALFALISTLGVLLAIARLLPADRWIEHSDSDVEHSTRMFLALLAGRAIPRLR